MKNIIIYGQVEHGKLTLDNRPYLNACLKSVKKAERVEVTIAPIRQDKTAQQLKYYYGVLIPAFCEETGYTKEEVDGLLKKIFLTVNKGTKKEYVKSLSELSVKAMSDYIDSCVMFGAEHAVFVPPANLGD